MTKKRILILFSGGIDSTYLMYKALLEGNDVFFINNIIENNASQTTKEGEAIVQIVEWLKQRFPFQQIESCDFRMKFCIEGFWMHSHMFGQPFMWLCSLGIVLQSINKKVDEIHYGLIARDDALSYIDDLKASFDALMMTKKTEKFKGKLKFPLIKYLKSEIIDELPKELLRLTSSCEYDTNDKYCNHCHSCKTLKEVFGGYEDLNLSTMQNSLEQISEYENRNDELRKAEEDVEELQRDF
jgi:7-cyano-7-deazaguanine synthase in queuosine biosynthesis